MEKERPLSAEAIEARTWLLALIAETSSDDNSRKLAALCCLLPEAPHTDIFLLRWWDSMNILDIGELGEEERRGLVKADRVMRQAQLDETYRVPLEGPLP